MAVLWTCSVRLCKDVLQYLNEEIQPILCGERGLGGEEERETNPAVYPSEVRGAVVKKEAGSF